MVAERLLGAYYRGCTRNYSGFVALALFGTRFLTQIVLPGIGGPFCGFVTLGIPMLRGYTVCTIYHTFRSMFTGEVSLFGGIRGDYIYVLLFNENCRKEWSESRRTACVQLREEARN